MDYVHNYGNAVAVGLIHKGLELLRSAEAAAEGEEVGYLITEASVVRMLLKGHYLNYIVAQTHDAREHIATEVLEAGYLLLFSGHSDMALVDERGVDFARGFMFPFIRLCGLPDLGGEDFGLRVLYGTGDIGRQPFSPAALPFYPELVEVTVVQEDFREPEFPVALAYRFEGEGFGTLPVVAVSDEVDAAGVGSPFAEHPAVSFVMKSVVQMIVYRFAEGPFPCEFGFCGEDILVACIYCSFPRSQPRVHIVDFLHISLYFL